MCSPVCVCVCVCIIHHGLADHALDSWSPAFTLPESLQLIIARSMCKAVIYHTPHTPSSCSRTVTAWSSVKLCTWSKARTRAYPMTGRDVTRRYHWATKQCVCVCVRALLEEGSNIITDMKTRKKALKLQMRTHSRHANLFPFNNKN